jgi:NAD-reducing hydrogenase large subunit
MQHGLPGCVPTSPEEGIGVAEAPRGTLLHHYRVDRDGIVQWANLVIATGHNNLAMNRVSPRWPAITSRPTGSPSRC